MTFESNRSACFALIQHMFNKKVNNQQEKFNIEPVNPWDQLKENDWVLVKNENEVDPDIFKLDDKCFLQVIKYLDRDSIINLYETCNKFKGYIDQHNCFQRFQKFTILVDWSASGYESTLNLKLNTRALRYIGQHVTHLHANRFWMCKHDSIPYLRTLAQFLGPNLQKAHLFFDVLNGNRISIIAPILRNLETLDIDLSVGHTSKEDIDFQDYCPKLVELMVGPEIPFIRSCKPWPSLKHLSLYHLPGSSTLASFIQQNPQLTSLGIPASISVIRAIVDHLPMITKLSIYQGEGGDALIVDCLGHLRNLTEIKLDADLMVMGLERILNCLATLPLLRKISLRSSRFLIDMYNRDERKNFERALLNLAEQSNNLEQFRIGEISISEPTLVELIRVARLKGLKMLNYKPYYYNPIVYEPRITDELIPNIVDALRLDRSPSTEPLIIDMPYIYDKNSHELITLKDVEANVHINPPFLEYSELWSLY